jgi:hypothetical protein
MPYALAKLRPDRLETRVMTGSQIGDRQQATESLRRHGRTTIQPCTTDTFRRRLPCRVSRCTRRQAAQEALERPEWGRSSAFWAVWAAFDQASGAPKAKA